MLITPGDAQQYAEEATHVEPEDEAEIDPLVERLSRLEEVQRRFLEMVDGMSRAISILSDELAETQQITKDRVQTLRELLEDHKHDNFNQSVLVSAYLAKETNRRG